MKSKQLTNLMHKFLFYNKFIIFVYMFRALLCLSSGGQIVLYSSRPVHRCGPDGHLQSVTIPDAV